MDRSEPHIDHVAVAGALFREALSSKDGMDQLVRQYGRLLSFDEVRELTGWGEKKLMEKIRSGDMPMVKDGSWFITWTAYIRALDRYYEKHLPKQRCRPKTRR